MKEYGLKLWRLDNFEGNPPTYFKLSVGLPALASILGELRNRFGPKQILVSRLLVIHPQNLITIALGGYTYRHVQCTGAFQYGD